MSSAAESFGIAAAGAVVASLTLLLLSACQSGSSRPAAAIVVTSEERQRIDGWGSALTSDREPLIGESDTTATLRKRLSSLILDRLGENVVRVFVGDFGPGAAPPPADGTAGAMTRRARFIRAARARGVRIMLTGANAPAAWKSGNRLRDGMEVAYGDYLAAWAKRLQAVGARGDYLAIGNEISNPDFFNMSETQAALVYHELARRIRGDHLRLRLATGDNESFSDASRYSALELRDPLVARYAGVVAAHAYDKWGSSGRAAQHDLARLARGRGLRVWMTEHLAAAPPPGECGKPGPVDDTIHSALALADDITTLMNGPAEPNAYLTLRAVARDHGAGIAAIVLTPPTADCARPRPATGFRLTKRFYAELQYTRAAPRGSVRLVLRQRLPQGMKAIAFQAPGGSRRVVVVNESNRGRRVLLDFGGRSGRLSARRTSARESYAPLTLGSYRGKPKVVLARAESITTFFLR